MYLSHGNNCITTNLFSANKTQSFLHPEYLANLSPMRDCPWLFNFTGRVLFYNFLF